MSLLKLKITNWFLDPLCHVIILWLILSDGDHLVIQSDTDGAAV